MLIRPASFLPLAGFMLASVQYANADCASYGIDIVNGGSYFINTLSNDSFTAVTQWSGCNNDTADVILVDPNGNEDYCTDIPMNPDYTSEMTTCPLLKNQMVSGEYELTLISNNGEDADDEPIAFQRNFYITAGPQQTVTATPTVSFTKVVTPTVLVNSTTWITSTITKSNSKTVTVPSATVVVTITPTPVTVTSTTTLVRTLKSWTYTAVIVTSTVTASCTVPPRPWQPDPTWSWKPQILVNLPTGLSLPPSKRDIAYAIRDDLRNKRRTARLADEVAGIELDKRNLAKRSVDVPTVTVTETTLKISSTTTVTTAATTITGITVSTTTTTSTLPPHTVISGVAKQTVTAPQSTKTRLSVTTTYTSTVRTITASYTQWSIVTPTASATACKKAGGHFGSNLGINPGGHYGH